MGRVVAAAAYANGRRVADIGIADGREWADRPDHFVWIGIHAPDAADLRMLGSEFGLHALAVEDALTNSHLRPKLEVYGNGVFVVLRTVHREDGGTRFGETHVFAAKGYVISVRHGHSSSYGEVRARCESAPNLLRHGEDYVLYAILDFIVGNYFPVIEAIDQEVVQIEKRVLRHPLTRLDIERIHQLRRGLRRLRQAVLPVTDICRRLEHLDLEFIHDPIRPYYRDVADHVQLVSEQIDALRETLDHAFEAGILLEQSRQGGTTRQFAAWAAILAVPTAIAGIYGMNFDHMPELRWTLGYPAVLLLIATVCIGLYVKFKRSGWL